MKPPGALSRKQVLALGKIRGRVIYKVFDVDADLHSVTCNGEVKNGFIMTIDQQDVCHTGMWFNHRRKSFGYLFDNYFHALAYSLKLKAEHGQKIKPEERTGMAGAP
jgi:hypothetical protein